MEGCRYARIIVIRNPSYTSMHRRAEVTLCHVDGGGAVEGAVVGARRRVMYPERFGKGVVAGLGQRSRVDVLGWGRTTITGRIRARVIMVRLGSWEGLGGVEIGGGGRGGREEAP